tara:strand:- start:41 stop:460 length:420 start_codon:yes stop_codon:yes gene_type:complete
VIVKETMPKLCVKANCYFCKENKKVELKLKYDDEDYDGKAVCKECTKYDVIEFTCSRCDEHIIADANSDWGGSWPIYSDPYCFSCWETECEERRLCECCEEPIDVDDFWADWFADCKNCVSEKDFEEAKEDYEKRFTSD